MKSNSNPFFHVIKWLIDQNLPSKCSLRFPFPTYSTIISFSSPCSKYPYNLTRFRCSIFDKVYISFLNSYRWLCKASCIRTQKKTSLHWKKIHKKLLWKLHSWIHMLVKILEFVWIDFFTLSTDISTFETLWEFVETYYVCRLIFTTCSG